MPPFILAALKSPITWIAAAVIGTLIVLAIVYGKGKDAGESGTAAKVNAKTIETIDRARTEKEKADATVRDKPIDAVIDGLR